MTSGRIVIGAALCGVLCAAAACTGEPSGDTRDGTAAVLAPGRPGEQARTLSPEEAEDARERPRVSQADLRYVRMMITHHRQALRMTELVDDRARDERVRGMAARIADSQGPEIDAMSAWLRRNEPTGHQHGGHDGHDESGHADMPGMAGPAQLDTLSTATGHDFDQLFLRLMITHHEGAVTMAREVLGSGSDVLVEEMAQGVIATQTKEIARMSALVDR